MYLKYIFLKSAESETIKSFCIISPDNNGAALETTDISSF